MSTHQESTQNGGGGNSECSSRRPSCVVECVCLLFFSWLRRESNEEVFSCFFFLAGRLTMLFLSPYVCVRVILRRWMGRGGCRVSPAQQSGTALDEVGQRTTRRGGTEMQASVACAGSLESARRKERETERESCTKRYQFKELDAHTHTDADTRTRTRTVNTGEAAAAAVTGQQFECTAHRANPRSDTQKKKNVSGLYMRASKRRNTERRTKLKKNRRQGGNGQGGRSPRFVRHLREFRKGGGGGERVECAMHTVSVWNAQKNARQAINKNAQAGGGLHDERRQPTQKHTHTHLRLQPEKKKPALRKS